MLNEDTHLTRRLHNPTGWYLRLSLQGARRLVVFIHGFHGAALASWREFDRSGHVDQWWRESDLLFVGYDSVREDITGVATNVRRALPHYFPSLPPAVTTASGVSIGPAREPYDELVLVGHSLGGVVVRRALADAALEWERERRDRPETPLPPILQARVCLFSPASAGFRPAGLIGLFRASPGWSAAEMYLRRSSAYTDLLPDSDVLKETRRRTERLHEGHEELRAALSAAVLFANPDLVVRAETYQSDRSHDVINGKDHRGVCKPGGRYREPWAFVQDGRASWLG